MPRLKNGDTWHSKIRNAQIYFGCRGPCTHKFEIDNDTMMEIARRNLPMSPFVSEGWALCPQFCTILYNLGKTLWSKNEGKYHFSGLCKKQTGVK